MSLTADTYQVLRQRLNEAADDLRQRFARLNAERASVFGNLESRLIATVHVSTDHNCVPRDLYSFGSTLLLGYNVQFGLKNDVAPADVFSLYRLDGEIAHQLPIEPFHDPRFLRDFAELYRYYRNTVFSRFACHGPYLYMVFQVGKTPQDFKAFKWMADGEQLRYIDNRSDQEVKNPEQQAFRWQRATRDQHRFGTHPHISVQDIVFVECVGGDLTIKIEDNTETGAGIYSEPVDNADQTLDDAEIHYCLLGNLVLLKIRPYQEKEFRYIVYSVKRRQAMRLDPIGAACVQLPDDHGIIFPTGFFLQTGAYKLFDHGLRNTIYQKTIAAPNGEDFLYQFFEPVSGSYLHLRYNLIRQEVDTPLICHGQSYFDDGRMITMRAQDHPQKHHALQIWQTPFVGPNYQAPVTKDSMLYKIGNRDLVRAMAECQETLQLVDKDESYADLYVDLAKRSNDLLDSYFWIDRPETFQLAIPIQKIRDTAEAAIDEYEKVVRVRTETSARFGEAQKQTNDLIRSIERGRFESIEEFISLLAQLRQQRGIAIGLKDLKYIDLEAVEALEKQLSSVSEKLGQRCVQFLLNPASFAPYHQRIEQVSAEVQKVSTASVGKEIDQRLTKISGELELLIETISQIPIEDLTHRTAIVDATGNLLAELNRVRAGLKGRMRDLLSGEMEADFASQTKLLDQSASGALDTAQSPEQVDTALTRTMLQLEELESRFAEYDSLLAKLSEKRESLYAAFETKRQQLVETRARRADSLASAANRVLEGISKRTERIDTPEELRSYLASDPMVDKVRRIAGQLRDLGDSVRMEDLLGKLKTIADDAIRQQRDRKELFVDGDAIRLGNHLFSVHRHPIELTTVVREEKLQLHITGTQFFQPIDDEAIQIAKDLWNQHLPSENDAVYRAEYLADSLFRSFASGQSIEGMGIKEYRQASEQDRSEWIRRVMQSKHEEGYSRGVHDRDASLILDFLLCKQEELGLLVFPPRTRALGWFAWKQVIPDESRIEVERWIESFRVIQGLLHKAKTSRELEHQIHRLLLEHAKPCFGPFAWREACSYLVQQLQQNRSAPAYSPQAIHGMQEFNAHLPADERTRLLAALRADGLPHKTKWLLALNAIDAFLAEREWEGMDPIDQYREEIALILIESTSAEGALPEVSGKSSMTLSPHAVLEPMAGESARIVQGQLPLHFHEFRSRLDRYRRRDLPRFQELQKAKHRYLLEADRSIRTGEFKAKVLTSFVRNRLIDEVFLPRIGDNLAKQLGAAGENKRTDRMGLLLLISPPGYGKTTLMEYVANRLGLVFVKVNGPALGHSVTSLDPNDANNAASREEVQRINLALEMGENVMLYLDDIQHCHPELLQRFIPLCDATRKIEGVWQGVSKSYDLRGRKFAVVMAGNPYTESGQRFQIPDMLANRADIYNLGEIIGGAKDAFEMSYLENCLTSNAALQPLARASIADQHAVIRAAERGSLEGIDLEQNLSHDAITEMFEVLRKLVKVRDVVLKVNREYIKSAAQADAYRTEPPFKLQGSYRNMNRIAEKVVAIMNDEELNTTILSSYEQDAQTLTRDGESNMLKFRELLGIQTEKDKARWEQIRYAYVENVRTSSIQGDDQVAQVLKTMIGLRDGLESIRRTIAEAIAQQNPQTDKALMSQSINAFQSKLEMLAGELSQGLLQVGRQLEANAAFVPDQKVLVQHTVPRVMTDLIRSQFQLLYDGLKPILESSTMQTATMQRLQKAMEECVLQYQAMQKEIEASEERADGSTISES